MYLNINTFFFYRPAYGWIKNLRNHFPAVPLMALTATATPEMVGILREILKDPVCETASINKQNITYEVHQIIPSSKFTQTRESIILLL